MSEEKAAEVLGLHLIPAETFIHDAYGVAMRRAHPDHGGTGDAEQFKRIKAARDLLLKEYSDTFIPRIQNDEKT